MVLMQELALEIKKELDMTLERIYNHRKGKEGLVSIHNHLVHDVKRVIHDWYDYFQDGDE